MLIYLLKSSACMAVLFFFYKLLLEKENMHHFKRFYLLASILAALIIPLISFTSYIEAPLIIENTGNFIQQGLLQNSSNTTVNSADAMPVILWSIYGLGVLILGLKFIVNISDLIYTIRKSPKEKAKGFIKVLLSKFIPPHTFFNYIFLNKNKYEAGQIPVEVLLHEQTHARQKHSIDVVFIEIMQVLFWFNPLVYLLKKVIKLNHEFLADMEVLNQGINPGIYQQTLLQFSSYNTTYQLTNAFNYSSIKKRFQLMKKQSTQKAVWFRTVLLLPLMVMLILGFSKKEIIEKKHLIPEITNEIIIQDGASAKQVAEYNKLAKYYNEQDQDNLIVKLKDVKRLKYLFQLMTDVQRSKAQPLPKFPPPPPPPPLPENATEAQKIHYKKMMETYKNQQKSDPYKNRIKMDAKFEVEDAPPPPPPPPNATEAQKKKYKFAKKYYETQKGSKIYKLRTQNGEASDIEEKMPPPPPPNPTDHMIELAKKGAEFYYEGKKISSDKALEIVKKTSNIHIQVKEKDSKKPIVELSTRPYSKPRKVKN